MQSSTTAGSGVQYCKNDECGDPDGDRFSGPIDRNGCDLNAIRFQVEDFYDPGSNFKVESTKSLGRHKGGYEAWEWMVAVIQSP